MGLQNELNQHENEPWAGEAKFVLKPFVLKSFAQGWTRPWLRTIALVVGMCAIVGAAQPGQQTPVMDPNKPYLLPQTNRVPDANAQMEMREQQTKDKTFEAINLERKKQIAADSARLLKLATDLKAEVDKTNKDTLSVSVIRKADEIEKLAHAVREKMKASVGN